MELVPKNAKCIKLLSKPTRSSQQKAVIYLKIITFSSQLVLSPPNSSHPAFRGPASKNWFLWLKSRIVFPSDWTKIWNGACHWHWPHMGENTKIRVSCVALFNICFLSQTGIGMPSKKMDGFLYPVSLRGFDWYVFKRKVPIEDKAAPHAIWSSILNPAPSFHGENPGLWAPEEFHVDSVSSFWWSFSPGDVL